MGWDEGDLTGAIRSVVSCGGALVSAPVAKRKEEGEARRRFTNCCIAREEEEEEKKECYAFVRRAKGGRESVERLPYGA